MYLIRPVVVVALLAGLATVRPVAAQNTDTKDSWPQAHALLSEGLYLEAGLGDYTEACNLYSQALQLEGLEGGLRAELMFRLASGWEHLGRVEAATITFTELLDEHSNEEPWSPLAHNRLLRLAERGHLVDKLPVEYRFDAHLGDWLLAGDYERRGNLNWSGEVGREKIGALLWQTSVYSQSRDDIYVAFARPSPLIHRVEMWVRAVEFPAHLILYLVEEGGSRFASGRYVIQPEDGWIRIRSEIDDFYLFPGEDTTRHPNPRRIEFLMLEDATATYSTDRGVNRILVDDVRVE